MKNFRRVTRGSTLLFLLSLVTACKVSDDAVAASTQMTATAASLHSYYAALAGSVTDTIALYELDAAISGIPFSAEERKLPEETRAEILKRRELAKTLAKLASSMAALSNSKAPADIETAATSFGEELTKIKALPNGALVPDAVGKAGNYLLEIVQQHEEKRAARAMDQTLAAVGDLFEKEKPTYDSIARTHIFQASQVAKDLINANGVDPAPMLEPALKPFALTTPFFPGHVSQRESAIAARAPSTPAIHCVCLSFLLRDDSWSATRRSRSFWLRSRNSIACV